LNSLIPGPGRREPYDSRPGVFCWFHSSSKNSIADALRVYSHGEPEWAWTSRPVLRVLIEKNFNFVRKRLEAEHRGVDMATEGEQARP